MTGLVLAAHAGLAAEMLKAAEMIVGEIEKAESISINSDDSAELIRIRIEEAIKKVGENGAIVITDMFGGTPANISLSFLEDDRVEVLTGMNLPMVMQFALERSSFGISQLAAKLQTSGRDSITVAGDFLRK